MQRKFYLIAETRGRGKERLCAAGPAGLGRRQEAAGAGGKSPRRSPGPAAEPPSAVMTECGRDHVFLGFV